MDEMMTDAQRRHLNALCGDVSKQVKWSVNGNERLMTKDSWRHFFCAHVFGWDKSPSIDGDELIIFSRSSKELTKYQASLVIDLILYFGAHRDPQVEWKNPHARQAWEQWQKMPEARA